MPLNQKSEFLTFIGGFPTVDVMTAGSIPGICISGPFLMNMIFQFATIESTIGARYFVKLEIRDKISK